MRANVTVNMITETDIFFLIAGESSGVIILHSPQLFS